MRNLSTSQHCRSMKVEPTSPPQQSTCHSTAATANTHDRQTRPKNLDSAHRSEAAESTNPTSSACHSKAAHLTTAPATLFAQQPRL